MANDINYNKLKSQIKDIILMPGIKQIKEAFSELKGIDTYLTKISKANDKLSKSQLAQIGTDSFDVADKYGKLAGNYLSAIESASRAGYDNAEAIAELSVAVQSAGDVTEDIANTYIFAANNAYKLNGSVKELTKIFDGSYNVSRKNAVSMQDLSDAMNIVGATAAEFNIPADGTTAALSTMIAATHQGGFEAARALRTIFLNIRQISDEEKDIDSEGLAGFERACSALNVKLKETKNGVLQLRNPMEVLKELSAEYSELSAHDMRKTDLLSSVGGKLPASQLDALLSNWDMYEKMLRDYSDGEGSMTREAEKTANSWEGSMNRMSNSFTKLVDTMANQDGIISTINLFSDLIEVANILTKGFGTFSSLWGNISGLGGKLGAIQDS